VEAGVAPLTRKERYWSDINAEIIKSLASLEEKEYSVNRGLGMH